MDIVKNIRRTHEFKDPLIDAEGSLDRRSGTLPTREASYRAPPTPRFKTRQARSLTLGRWNRAIPDPQADDGSQVHAFRYVEAPVSAVMPKPLFALCFDGCACNSFVEG